jgi:peptidoglycan/xylan/chitin deacetylase (PgdA/CDA1 family)
MTQFQSRRVVMMIEQSWPGLYMATRLAGAGLLCAVIVEREPLNEARWSLRGLRRAARIAGWRPALESFVGFRHGIRHSIGRIRNPGTHPQLSDLRKLNVDVHRVTAFKSEQCHELLQRLAPDVTIICGTPILPESLLSIARICTLNTHTSVLPHYRGGGSLDWPLFFRDTEKIGFTIHQAVAKVDAGPYLCQEAIAVRNGDTGEDLLRRAFVRATERMTEILRESPLDATDFKPYEKPLAYSWRTPDSMVRRYIYGPSLRHRARPVVQRVVWKAKLSPFPRRKDHGITVFFFHRALANDTPQSDWRRILGHPTVDELREKLLYLKERFEIIPAARALELIDRRQPLRQSYAVITADDGYRDFRTHFLPLAESLSVPATFFVCSGAITSRSIWFQKLYDLITQIRGDRLYLPWADRRIYFGDVEHRALTVERVIIPSMKRLTRENRRRRLEDLLESNRVDSEADPRDAFCDMRDLLELKASRMIELHLHSHEHDPYETLTDEELEQDIIACRRFFSETLGIESTVLAYPHGGFRSEHAPIFSRLGITHAFSTVRGFEQPPTARPYSILRAVMDNEPLAGFHWTLSKMLRG